jgi:hypothetical protein
VIQFPAQRVGIFDCRVDWELANVAYPPVPVGNIFSCENFHPVFPTIFRILSPLVSHPTRFTAACKYRGLDGGESRAAVDAYLLYFAWLGVSCLRCSVPP